MFIKTVAYRYANTKLKMGHLYLETRVYFEHGESGLAIKPFETNQTNQLYFAISHHAFQTLGVSFIYAWVLFLLFC